jgi:Protein of unknown function (DUF3108)
MILVLARPRLRFVCCGVLALCWFAAPAAADGPITTRIEVSGFAGVHVLTLHSRTDENGGRYAITVDYATEGLAKLFVDLTTRAQASGRLTNGLAQPDWFRNVSRRNSVERHSRVDYRPDGAVDGGTTPAAPDPIAPARVRGTVDNLTAYFRLERQLARTGSCALTARIFDGRHAYDLVFSDAGQQTLSPSGGQNFAGPTIACHMERRNWPDVVDSEKDEGARGGTIWYARLVPGDLLVPVRTQMDTQLGVVEGFLAELHGPDVDLALMP